ncbi:hypothetical protein ACFROC_07025 [Nocardia tengchongensis]|uniref:hypothetical protein n=1 Tax=Nocardia tengchongensis TaxID=2055889 RepID=UPI0036A07446
MNNCTVNRWGLGVVAGAVFSLGVAAVAVAIPSDDSFVTVSGNVQCVGGSYDLSVLDSDIQPAVSSYYFADGPDPDSAVAISSAQVLGPVNATASWTPTTSGTHYLWLIGQGRYDQQVTVGPAVVNVLDTSDPACAAPASPPTSSWG